MTEISDRISFIDHASKTTIVILPKKQPWVIALMGAWLGMWITIGLITCWALFTMKLNQQEQIILWVFLSFWAYYSIRVGRSFLWLLWGQELLKIDEIGLHIKRSIRTYGKSVPYFFENINGHIFWHMIPRIIPHIIFITIGTIKITPTSNFNYKA